MMRNAPNHQQVESTRYPGLGRRSARDLSRLPRHAVVGCHHLELLEAALHRWRVLVGGGRGRYLVEEVGEGMSLMEGCNSLLSLPALLVSQETVAAGIRRSHIS